MLVYLGSHHLTELPLRLLGRTSKLEVVSAVYYGYILYVFELLILGNHYRVRVSTLGFKVIFIMFSLISSTHSWILHKHLKRCV